MINDFSFYNQVRQKTPHSFRFEDSYDSLCHKLYLQDIEDQNLRLKTERIDLHIEDYTEDTKALMETQCPTDCPENDPRDIASTLRTAILNKESHVETKESHEESFGKEEETDKTHTAEKDSSVSRTSLSINLNSSHAETMSKPFEEEPTITDLHFRFELITERNSPTEENSSNGDAIAEEQINDPEIENTDQHRQANKPTRDFLDQKKRICSKF